MPQVTDAFRDTLVSAMMSTYPLGVREMQARIAHCFSRTELTGIIQDLPEPSSSSLQTHYSPSDLPRAVPVEDSGGDSRLMSEVVLIAKLNERGHYIPAQLVEKLGTGMPQGSRPFHWRTLPHLGGRAYYIELDRVEFWADMPQNRTASGYSYYFTTTPPPQSSMRFRAIADPMLLEPLLEPEPLLRRSFRFTPELTPQQDAAVETHAMQMAGNMDSGILGAMQEPDGPQPQPVAGQYADWVPAVPEPTNSWPTWTERIRPGTVDWSVDMGEVERAIRDISESVQAVTSGQD